MPEILSNLNPNQRFWIVIKFAVIISVIESVAQANIKGKGLFVGMIGYIIIVLILYNAYNYEGLGHMNLVWSCISIITCYLIGHFVFKESFNKYTLCAIILAIGAIYFAHMADEIDNCTNV